MRIEVGGGRRVNRSVALVALLGIVVSCAAPADQASSPSGEGFTFTSVTEEAGLAAFKHVNGAVGNKWYPEPMGSGGGFLDYDGDGWLDVLLLGGGTWDSTPSQALWLYHNNGDGTFTETTEAAGLRDVDAYSIGLATADYDNDGDDDLFLSNLGINMLFRNDDGVFTEVGEDAGIANTWRWSSSVLFFDADNDGWLDLYVGNYVEWTPETDIFCPEGGEIKLYCVPATYTGVPSQYYRNNGDGTFSDLTEEAGFIPVLGKTLGVTEMDFNKDGWSDLAVANDGEGDLLYENNRDGTFTEMGRRSGFAFSEHGEARAGMGIDSGVVDSTGEVTIFVGNFSEEMVGVYQHVGGGSFLDRAAASRIGYPSILSLTFGVVLVDFDFDTDLDLFIANGHVYPDRLDQGDKITYRQIAQVFMNRGDGQFDEEKQETGVLAERIVARAVASADYDRDGDIDLLLTENDGPAHLWRNDLNTPNFLRVSVTGATSNRNGLGTEIIAVVDGLRMYRRVRTGSSYLAQSEIPVTFGLRAASSIDSLLVAWPSGKTHQFTNVSSGQHIHLNEDEDVFQAVVLPGFEGNQE